MIFNNDGDVFYDDVYDSDDHEVDEIVEHVVVLEVEEEAMLHHLVEVVVMVMTKQELVVVVMVSQSMMGNQARWMVVMVNQMVVISQ